MFRAGDVFTVEPGLYVSPELLASLPDTPGNRAMLKRLRPAVEKYKNFGVRIEDDYALTERGLDWLSSEAPREINGDRIADAGAGAGDAGGWEVRGAGEGGGEVSSG